MSRQEIKQQAATLKRPGTTARCVDEGENVVVILEHFTPPGAEKYTPSELEALAFLVPVTFPESCPDATGFYVKPVGIRVAGSNTEPKNTGSTMLMGEPWRKFSWAPKSFGWDPDRDTLETYLATIEKRFRTGI